MNIDDLLTPRYKVMADFPYKPAADIFPIGQIIKILEGDNPVDSNGNPLRWLKFEKYPNLFRRLEWWEYRKPEDMPKYLMYKSTPESNLYIIKVDRHFRNTFGLMNKVGCISDGEYYSYSKTLPSTEHEFLVWKAITHPNLLTAEERTKISEHKMTNDQVARRISGLD